MLEIIIIILLGLSLFLLLRHYPETGARNMTKDSGKKLSRLFSYVHKFGRKRDDLELEKLVHEGQSEIVAPAEIEDASKKYSEPNSELAETLFKAEQALESNDLRMAEERALEVIAKNKRSSYAYFLLGKVAFSRGQFNDAREAFRAATKCDRNLAEAFYYLGRVDYRSDNLTGAIENLQKSIYIEKGHPDWYAELGKAYMEVRQYAKAAKVLKRASSLDIDNKEYRELASEAEDKQRAHSIYSRNK